MSGTATTTEAKLLDTSRQLFNRLGYQGMTLRQVAKEVGIEAQSIYNYVSSKEALLERILRAGLDELLGGITSAVEAAPRNATERLLAAVRAHVMYHASSPHVVSSLRSSLVHFGKETRDSLIEALEVYEAVFIDIVRDGVASGEFSTVRVVPVAKAIIGMGEAVTNWWHPSDELRTEELCDLYACLALNMVAEPAKVSA